MLHKHISPHSESSISPAPFHVCILGCGSARPSLRHAPAAQALIHHGRVCIIDCGEGAQLQLARFGISPAKITDIFISHLHGDHLLGLPGLISTMVLDGRTEPVRIHIAPEGARLVRDILSVVSHGVSPELVQYHTFDPAVPALILDEGAFSVSTIPLLHSIPAAGFIFREKEKPRHIRSEAIRQYSIPYAAIPEIRRGADFVTSSGLVIPNSDITAEPSPAYSYAYCSDTAFSPQVAELVRGVTVLYHEATYDNTDIDKAAERGHSTAFQAGQIARQAGAGILVIGHYSTKIVDEQSLAREAAAEFGGPVIAADEGLKIDIALT
ncbi:MAG: ribonuclease Z [Muribaculaceae bacterium]|nr:ribonuclease Z [Muribaculaceae bacterium]